MAYADLLGAVLDIIADEGRKTITTKEVILSETPVDAIAEYQKGKVVTDEEYEKIIDEKMKEMGQNGGEGQNVRVIENLLIADISKISATESLSK